MKTFKEFFTLGERSMSSRQKLVQMQHYWNNLSHTATDDMKKKNMKMRFGIKNIKLDKKGGKLVSFDESVEPAFTEEEWGDILFAKELKLREISEEITKNDLNQIEKYADKLFAAVGIDIEFTRHFLDRVNDARNKKPINSAELIRLFRLTYKKYGKKIAKMNPDAEAVISDMETDVNMPFVLNLDKDGMLDLVAKTVMRKKDFKTRNQKLRV